MKAAHYPGTPRRPPAAPARAAECTWWVVGIGLALGLTLSGCGGGRSVRATSPAQPMAAQWPAVAPADPAAANGVLMRAISLVGTPYRYGGNTPEGGFDCSGLVTYVFRDALDLRLPRSSRELAGWQGPAVDPKRLAPADLVFFGQAGVVTHVGIYVGDGRFVHAPSTGGTVRLDRLDGPYWARAYSGAKRVLH